RRRHKRGSDNDPVAPHYGGLPMQTKDARPRFVEKSEYAMLSAEAINHFSDRFPSIRKFASRAHLATSTALARHQGETKVHSTGSTIAFRKCHPAEPKH